MTRPAPEARILIVCTGNVCRSPLVERVLRRTLDDAYGPGVVEVSSAGTGALVGHAMDQRAALVLEALGGDAAGFQARHLVESHVAAADLVLTATRAHRSTVVRHHPRALRRAFTVRELARLVDGADLEGLPDDPAGRIAGLADLARSRRHLLGGTDQDELDVVDPFRAANEVYEQMRGQLQPALEVIEAALVPGPRG